MSESSPFDFSVLDTTYDNTLVQTLPHMATTVSTGMFGYQGTHKHVLTRMT